MSAAAGVVEMVHGCASAFTSLGEAPLWALTDTEVTDMLAAVRAARSGLDELESRLVRVGEERGLPRAAGITSTTAWVAQVTGVSRSAAARVVSTARMVDETCEPTRRAWAGGDLTAEQVRVICGAIGKLPDWLGMQERFDAQVQLIGFARTLDLDGLKKAANHVVEVVDPDGADEILGRQLEAEEARAWDATRLSWHRRGDGTTGGTFVIPDVEADLLRAAVEGLCAPRRRKDFADQHGLSEDDVRSLPMPQRHGLAFCELLTHLPTDALPPAGGLAATVAVTIEAEQLRTGLRVARTTSDHDMSARQAQRIACNAHLVAMYLDGQRSVLDFGTTRRLYDRHQRLVLAVRDSGCCWAGCDRPPSRCEAHQLTFISDDGPPDIDNAALFCFFHHHLLHEREWEARMGADGVVEVIPPPRVDPERLPRRHARFTKLSPRAA